MKHDKIIPKKVDLHLHSNYSDGSDTPTELIQKAKDIRLDVIALTDHDTIGGWEEFRDAGESNGIRTINGIELSLEDIEGATNVHLLGYFPNGSVSAAAELKKYSLSRIQAKGKRCSKMVSLLQDYGLKISEAEVQAEVLNGRKGDKEGGKNISRVHVARAVDRLNPGRFNDFREVFDKYIEFGKRAYVPIEGKLYLNQAISWVKSLGGLAILAHPGVSNDPVGDIHRGEKILLMALEYGIDGGEGDYTYHKNNPYRNADPSITPFLCQHYIQILTERGKIATSGSDYHGKNKKIELGEQGGRVYNAERLLEVR